MKTMTATALRREMFSVLDEALKGRNVLVRTRRGDVVLKRAGRAALCQEAQKPKIGGRIEVDLASADEALRGHIRWPHA